MDRSDLGSDPAVRPGTNNVPAAARALDPYGLDCDFDSDPRRLSADLVSDLIRLIAVAERHGLRPARAARWRTRLLTTPDSPDLLTRCEQRLRGWLLRCAEQTAG
jgi:hypothetical protein